MTTVPAKHRVSHRDKVEAAILGEAVRQFAECGYEGTSIATVAERAGLSKQNLMYYFPTKQALYQRVLDNVLDDWLARMASLADPGKDPGDVLRAYVRAKLTFSREQPLASRVYAMEVIGGAKLYADQIRPFVPQRYRVLGTDGFGRSDYRRRLRQFFEVDRHFVTVAALRSLAEEGTVPAAKVSEAIAKYDINPDKPDPVTI